MDREQKATMENCGRGLGLMGPWEGDPNWYGGRIQQILRLAKASGSYTVLLERLENRRSHRIARFLGSRRVLQMRIKSDLVNKERDQLLEFLLQSFVICGRVYRPFASKDGTLYMMETDDNRLREMDETIGDQHRMSFASFVAWHNPFHLNTNQVLFSCPLSTSYVADDCQQPMSKWSTRWSLGLSTSRPVLEFEEDNILDDRTPDL
jgi:hypothetical protein